MGISIGNQIPNASQWKMSGILSQITKVPVSFRPFLVQLRLYSSHSLQSTNLSNLRQSVKIQDKIPATSAFFFFVWANVKTLFPLHHLHSNLFSSHFWVLNLPQTGMVWLKIVSSLYCGCLLDLHPFSKRFSKQKLFLLQFYIASKFPTFQGLQEIESLQQPASRSSLL